MPRPTKRLIALCAERPLVGPPCEYPHGDPSTWPDKLEEVPHCGRPGVEVGRMSHWETPGEIVVCEDHLQMMESRIERYPGRAWLGRPWRPEMVRGRDGQP